MSKPPQGSDTRKHESISESRQDASHRPEYQWPPVRDPDLSYKTKNRNPIHSILTALPLVMLVTGLYMYYRGESRQTQSVPIMAQSVERSGIFTGLSATRGQHYLWLEIDGVAKGVRIQEEQVTLLEPLERNAAIQIRMAPSVNESTIYWAWYVAQSGNVFLDTHLSNVD